jgi:hypothetical protein
MKVCFHHFITIPPTFLLTPLKEFACAFGNKTVAARIIDDQHALCYSPPVNGTAEEIVTLNFQPNATVFLPVQTLVGNFTYYGNLVNVFLFDGYFL